MSPRTHVSRRLLPPIFLPNVGHNQSASRIIAFTFLTENVSNESAFFVQRAHPYRAFLHKYIRAEGQLNRTAILRNHTRTKFTASATTGGSTQLLHPSRLALIITEQSHNLYCFYCFYAIKRVNYTCSRTYGTINLFSKLQSSHHILLLLSTCSWNDRTACHWEPISTEHSSNSISVRILSTSRHIRRCKSNLFLRHLYLMQYVKSSV